ncbi:MAG: hypothetical protein ACREQV_01855, partial [Candidatus Binatia bacterium]
RNPKIRCVIRLSRPSLHLEMFFWHTGKTGALPIPSAAYVQAVQDVGLRYANPTYKLTSHSPMEWRPFDYAGFYWLFDAIYPSS